MAESPGTEPERLFAGFPGRMLVVLTLGSIAATFGRRVLSPLLPVIIDDLGITPFEAGIALSVATAFYAILQYPSGRLADQLTRRTVLVASLSAVFVGSVVLAATPTFAVFVVGAAIIGTSEGLYGPASRALLSDLFHRRRGGAFGLINTSIDVSGLLAAGTAIGILAVAAWQFTFVVVAVVVVPVLAVLYRLGREPIVVARIDVGIRETGVRLFSVSRIRWIVVAYTLYMVTVQGTVAFLPTLLQAEHGFSSTAASAAFGAMFGVGLLVKPLAGRLSDRVHRLYVGGSALLFSAAGVALLVTAASLPVAVAGVLLFGAGGKMFPPVMQAYLMDVFPDASKGGDFGAARSVFLVLASVGPAYVGFVAGRLSYTAAFSGFVLCVLVASGIVLRLGMTDPDRR